MKQDDLFPDGIIEVKSFTDPDLVYQIDVKKKTCSCPAFKKGKKPCKHMLSIPGLVKVEAAPTHPSVSAAMSALIKTVRLRHENDAVYWLTYLWTQFPKDRFRLQRRLLIICAEDNLSIPVMVKMSNWWASSRRDSLVAAAAEIMRVCRTMNWWEQPSGHVYMKAWFDAENVPNPHAGKKFNPTTLAEMEHYVMQKDVMNAFQLYYAFYTKGSDIDGKIFGQWIADVAARNAMTQARRTVCCFLNNVNVIGRDGNHTGQALHRLMFKRMGEQTCPKVSAKEAESAVEVAHSLWKEPKPIPSYLLDGIHTSGSDRRFAGMVKYMYGCCLAYEHYGRLDPADKWGNEIWQHLRKPRVA